jgi:hypothetical protein
MIINSKEYLNEINETYIKHMAVAFKIAINMFLTSVICLIHGFIPGLFEKTASNMIVKMHEIVSRNKLSYINTINKLD